MRRAVRNRWISMILAAIMILTFIPTGTLQAVAANQAGSFEDVTSDKYYYQPVLWAIENNVTSGTTKNTFSPNEDCTRGQIVTFLYNAAKGSPVNSTLQFSDVNEDKYYYKPVGWALSKKITAGTTATTFSPNQSCTRAQAVTFLWNEAGSPEVSATNYFEDVKTDKYYAKAVSWAVDNKITAGTSDKAFSPNEICTRGQIVTLLYNYAKSNSQSSSGSSSSHSSATPKAEENHVVTFLENDGSDGAYLISTVKHGSKVGQPDSPELEGYKFLGWYMDPDGIDKFDFNTPILTDIFLYAHWGNPDGSEGLYSTSTGGGTVFSITDIEKNGADFDVTINADHAAILILDILDENTETLIASGASYTPNYCEMTPITVSVEGPLPAHYLAKARIVDENENDLCNPFVTIHFTTKYAEYEAKTINDFGEDDVVVNFDDSPNENFGVLADGIKILSTGANDSANLIDLKYDEVRDEEGNVSAYKLTGYQIANPDENAENLQPGDRIMAATTDGNMVMFKISTIQTQPDGSLLLTEDMNCEMTDFYTYLKLDMTLVGNGSDVSSDSSDEDALVGATIVDISGAKVGKGFSRDIFVAPRNNHPEWKIKLSISGDLSVEISAHYDAKLFAKDYFEFSMEKNLDSTIEISTVITNDYEKKEGGSNTTLSEKKYVDKEIPALPDIPLATPVPALTINIGVKASTNLTYTGSFSVKYSTNNKSGFTYNTNSGPQKIDQKSHTLNIDLKGEIEFKAGAKASIGPAIAGGVLSGDVYADAGVKATATADLQAGNFTDAEEKHACTLCAEGTVKWYADLGGDVKFCVIKNVCEGTIIDRKFIDLEGPIQFPGGIKGKVYLSIINSSDSIYHGIPHFGLGSCKNKTYRITVKAKDGNNNDLTENVTVKKENGSTVSTKKTSFKIYLYDGKYTFSGKIDSKDISKTVVVSGAAKTVILTPNSGDGEITGKILSADNNDPIGGATILLSSGDVEIATMESDSNGDYTRKVPSGIYKMTISKEGYTTVTNYVSISDGTKKYVETTLMTAGSSWLTSRGGFSGTIRDAVSGNPIQGVSLDLRKGWNAPESEDIITTLKTNANGSFKYDMKKIGGLIFWGLVPGNYTLTAKKEGYATISFNIIVVSGLVTEGQDATMSTEVGEGTYRVVLTWGNTPNDLDSHYMAETKDQITEHIYYSNKTGSSANLDRDDTDSYGPETVTITFDKLLDGFSYSVHDYTNRNSDHDTALSASSASVAVYNGNKKVQTYNVPIGKIGNVWNVFSVDANGQFTDINTFESISDPGSVGQAA